MCSGMIALPPSPFFMYLETWFFTLSRQSLILLLVDRLAPHPRCNFFYKYYRLLRFGHSDAFSGASRFSQSRNRVKGRIALFRRVTKHPPWIFTIRVPSIRARTHFRCIVMYKAETLFYW